MAKRDSCPLDLALRQSKSNPLAYRVRISGCVGRIKVTGETTTVFVGLDRIDWRLADRVTHVNRADGSGKEVPWATQIKVKKAVLEKLEKLETQARSEKRFR